MSLVVRHWLFSAVEIVSGLYLSWRLIQDDSWFNYILLVAVMLVLILIHLKVIGCPKCGKPASCGEIGKVGPIWFYYGKWLEKKCSRCGTQLR